MHRPLHGPRIVAWAQIGREAHEHRVDLVTVEDVDAELLGWLREAHAS